MAAVVVVRRRGHIPSRQTVSLLKAVSERKRVLEDRGVSTRGSSSSSSSKPPQRTARE
jgi:hypothetical protein